VNPLNDYPDVRRWVYLVFWVAALAVGALNVGFLAAGGPDSLPVWLVVVNAVMPFVGGYIGYTARANVQTGQ